MQPSPPGWPRFSSSIYYRDAAAGIDFLCRAFGFSVRLRVEDDAGRIIHSELEYGGGLIMVGEERGSDEPDAWKMLMRSPAGLGGANTQSIMIYVEDADAHCAQARANGATILKEPVTTDYGEEHWTDRSYSAQDPEGHMWWIAQRLSTSGLLSTESR